MSTVSDAQGALAHAIAEAQSAWFDHSADIRHTIQNEEAEAVEFFEQLSSLKSEGWGAVQDFLRPYYNGRKHWPDLTDAENIEQEADRVTNRCITQLRDAADDLTTAITDHGMAHQLSLLGR